MIASRSASQREPSSNIATGNDRFQSLSSYGVVAEQALGERPRYCGALNLTCSNRLDSLKDSRLAHRPTHLELGEGLHHVDCLQLVKVNP